MFAIMFALTVAFLALVTFAGLMAWVGDIRNDVKARAFPKIASEVRTPRYVVNDDGLNDPFFDLPDEPTEEVPVDRHGSRPPSICPPMLADSGLAQVMAAHLRKRVTR